MPPGATGSKSWWASVSPLDEFLKQLSSSLVPRVEGVHFSPEVDSQTIEIGTNGAWVWIASSETSDPGKLNTQESLKLRRDGHNYMINALRVKIATESLELTRQGGGIGVIDLLRRMAPPPFGSADHHMGVFNLVQRVSAFAVPSD